MQNYLLYEHMNKSFLFYFIVLFFILFFSEHSYSQEKENLWPTKSNFLFQGFEEKNEGAVLDFLPDLDVGEIALLVHAKDTSEGITFTTSVIPVDYREDYVSFVWSSAISQSSSEFRGEFDFFIDGQKIFRFESHKDSASARWYQYNGGYELSFIPTEFPKGSQDAFGYMFLNVPSEKITAGQSLALSIKGNSPQSEDWYMPFNVKVENSCSFYVEPALVNTDQGLRQRIRAEIKHAGPPSDIFFLLNDTMQTEHRIYPGKRTFYLYHDPVISTQDFKIEVIKNEEEFQTLILPIKPINNKVVYFLPHSHIDIGFTHEQDEVAALQWKNIELGIDLAEKTQNYPDGSQFKWNTEITWSVDGLLQQMSAQQKERFYLAVRKGWLGIDALYANQLTGLQREEELIQNMSFANEIEDEIGVSIKTAMISDVPGYTWGIVESMAQSGIKYFSSGPNHMPHLPHGGYQVGRSLEVWGDRPFYWKSASGNEKVLFWMTSHGYSWFHSWSVDILSKSGGDEILDFLSQLDDRGYPYEIVQLRYTIGNDNGPPDLTMPDFIRDWNENYASPQFRIATTKEMMEDFEEKYGDELPIYSGDMTPYWEDGAASSALETGVNRQSADLLVQAESLSIMVDEKTYPDSLIKEAWKNVLLFSEHTWGANVSKSQPESPFTKKLWQRKKSFSDNGFNLSNEILAAALKSISFSSPSNSFQVINTNSWTRSDLVLFSPPKSKGFWQIEDENGVLVPSQYLSSGELAFVAKEIPPLSSKKYKLIPRENKPPKVRTNHTHVLQNDKFTIQIDTVTGSINSLIWKDNQNLIDTTDVDGFNSYWYSGIMSEDRSSSVKSTIQKVEEGDVINSIRVTSHGKGAHYIEQEIILVNGLDHFYLRNTINKKAIVQDENVRFSFPFNVESPKVRIDIPWGTLDPSENQIDGSNLNFFTAQRWIDVSNSDIGVTLATIEAPLVEIGDMTGQNWMSDMTTRPWIDEYTPSSKIYSWVMNNVWFVNYKASQEGIIPFRYVVKPHLSFDEFETKKFGVEQTTPLLVCPTSENATPIVPVMELVNTENVYITSMKKSKDHRSLIIRFFNPTHEKGHTSINWGRIRPKAVYRSNAEEKQLEAMGDKLFLLPFEVLTIRAEL